MRDTKKTLHGKTSAPRRKGKNRIVPVPLRKRYVPLVCTAFLVLLFTAGCDRFNADFGGFVDEQLKHFRETDGTFIKWLYLTGGAFGTDTVYGGIDGTEISVTVFSEAGEIRTVAAVFETGTGRKLEIPISFDADGQAKITVSTGSKSKEYTVTLVLSPYRVRLGDRFYEKLSEALVRASAGTVNNIIILQNITIDAGEAASIAALGAGKQITLAPEGDVTKIIKRGAGNSGSLFTVRSGASLTLEGGETGPLIIDGGKAGGITASAALVTIDGGTLTLNAGAVLRDNINTGTDIGDGGGAVYVGGVSGIFNMEGGLITGNEAGNGGGVCIGGGIFSMKGGVISGNEASYGGYGGGVYVYGTFGMSGSAVIAVDPMKNDVYLTPDNTISLTGPLDLHDGVSYAARITPPAYPSVGTPVVRVLAGSVYGNNGKFIVTPNGDTQWFIKNDGTLISNVVASRLEGTELYGTLAGAVEAATLGTLATNPDVITILQNIDSSATMGNGANGITIDGKHIKLVPASGGDKTIKRWPGNNGSLFTVEADASLTLQGTTVSGVTEELIVDGGAVWDIPDAPETRTTGSTATDALITVNGTLTMNTGAVLQNNYRSGDGNRGTVFVSGANAEFYMSGGIIRNNWAYEGGGVYVYSAAKFYMTGGVIGGNRAEWTGGAVNLVRALFEMSENAVISGNYVAQHDAGGVQVYGGSTLKLNGNASISGNKAYGNSGGVRVDGSVFEMSCGTISGNTAVTGSGGGLSLVGNCTFTMSAGTIESNTANTGGGGVCVTNPGSFYLNSPAARASISGNSPNQVAGSGTIGGTAGVTSGW